MRDIIECTGPELRAAISTVATEIPDLASDLDRHPSVVQTRLLEVLGATCSPNVVDYINYTGDAFPTGNAEVRAATALTKAERYAHIENGINHQHPLLVRGTNIAVRLRESVRRESTESLPGLRFAEDLQQHYAATAVAVKQQPWFEPSQKRYADLAAIASHSFLPFNLAPPPATNSLETALSGGDLPFSTVGLIRFVAMQKTTSQAPSHRRIQATRDISYLGLSRATGNLLRTVSPYDLDSLQGTLTYLAKQDRYVYQAPRLKPNNELGEGDLEQKQLSKDIDNTILGQPVCGEGPDLTAWFGPTLRCPVHRGHKLQDQIHAAIHAAIDYGLFDCTPDELDLFG